MTCTRCHGWMAEDHFLDLKESGGEMWIKAWRCLNCGNVFDPIMEQNRRRSGMLEQVSEIHTPMQEGAEVTVEIPRVAALAA